MKKLLLVSVLLVSGIINAQFLTPSDEARNQQMGRADMVTFSIGISYVTSFSFTLMESIKDKREVRLFSTIAVGGGIGLLKETADVYIFQDKFNGTDVLYCVGGSLIGFALTEATTAIIDRIEKKRNHKKLML